MKVIFSVLFSLIAIYPGYSQKTGKAAMPVVHKVIVQQVLQTTSYTYLKVKEDTIVNWIAIPKMEAKVGETYYTVGGIEMRDFPSKELNRTFPVVYFMDFVSKTPEGAIRKEPTAMDKTIKSIPDHSNKGKPTRKQVKYDPVPGSISVFELYKNKANYEGKVVKLRGQVVKYNEKIMGKNWIHLQDGTANGEEYDLTVTTNETVELGSIVTIKGKISLNKDFGSGYSFPVIMEEAVIIK